MDLPKGSGPRGSSRESGREAWTPSRNLLEKPILRPHSRPTESGAGGGGMREPGGQSHPSPMDPWRFGSERPLSWEAAQCGPEWFHGGGGGVRIHSLPVSQHCQKAGQVQGAGVRSPGGFPDPSSRFLFYPSWVVSLRDDRGSVESTPPLVCSASQPS